MNKLSNRHTRMHRQSKKKKKQQQAPAPPTETGGIIKQWYDLAVTHKQAYLLTVLDLFDGEDYPVECKDAAECRAQVAAHTDGMNRVTRVYDIALGWESLGHGAVSFPQLTPPQGDSSGWDRSRRKR
jgi:hypothetical protein